MTDDGPHDQPSPVPVAGAVRVDRRQRHDAAPAGRCRPARRAGAAAHGQGRQGGAEHRRARGVRRWNWATTPCASPRASAASAIRCRCRWRRCWRSTRARPGRAWRCPKTRRPARRRTSRRRRRPIQAATSQRPRARRTPAHRQIARTQCEGSVRVNSRVQLQLSIQRSPRRIGADRNGPAQDRSRPQHQSADVPIAAVLGIFEAERALESQPPVLAASQPQARWHGRSRRAIARPRRWQASRPSLVGTFGGRTRRAPEGEARRPSDDHHGPVILGMRLMCGGAAFRQARLAQAFTLRFTPACPVEPATHETRLPRR